MINYDSLKALVNIDSPTGYTETAGKFVAELLKNYGFSPTFTNKGGVKCALGRNPTLAITAHLDTLGAMVSKINENGTLRISKIGGLSLNGFEGSYCRIRTLEGETINGTLLLDNPATHVNKKHNSTQRTIANMHVRIDEVLSTKKEVEDLGIMVGDFVCFETKYQELPSGFVKSRFMDNKAGCFVLFEIAKYFSENKIEVPVELHFSNYEEIGHGGAAGYSEGIKELLVIDMGVVGDNQEGKETACSICAKDAGGPYDYAMRKTLVQLAQTLKIPFVIDVYPYYVSDGTAALKSGKDYRVGLIGPGVSASHGMERTHKLGIEATINLSIAYIEDYHGKIKSVWNI